MKVFMINDCDWYMADNLDDAIEAAVKLTGMLKDEVADLDMAYELPDEELDLLKFTDEDGVKRTFREELSRRSLEPQFFASSEY